MEIWIGRDGERHGPYKEADVREWLHSGKMSGSDLGWYEGLADWQPLSVLLPDAVVSASAATGTVPPGSTPLPQTTTAALEDYAGFWKRVAAYVIDYIVLLIPSKLIGSMLGATAATAAMEEAQKNAAGDPQMLLASVEVYMHSMWPALLLTSLVVWLYFALMESSVWQASIGKLVLGIRVTDLHGDRISLPRALGRYLAKFLSAIIVCIGFLMVAWTERKQGLHDMLAGTLVLNGRASQFNSTPADKPGQPNSGSFSA
ncbi:MAG: RDD family protein [Rhodanobacter sp.]